MKKTARKQREKNKTEQRTDPTGPSYEKPAGGLYTDPYNENEYYDKIAGGRYKKKEKSENRKNYERIQQKKKAKKRSNRNQMKRKTH